MLQNTGVRLQPLAGLMGGTGLRELRLFFVQFDMRVLFLVPNYWASGPFMCLKFLKESGRKVWTSILFEHEHHPSHHPRPWEIKARTFKMKHPMVTLPLKRKKRRRKKTTSLSFCATANIVTFLAGRGSYFVYV